MTAEVETATKLLEEARKRLDDTPREFYQCPVCLSGVRGRTEKDAWRLLEVHVKTAHPEIKEDVSKWRYVA